MIRVVLNGLSTGLLLQLAIGPVFVFIVNTVMQKSLVNGFIAIAAVVIVDYLYIIAAIIGAGKILEKEKYRRMFGIISSGVLMVFGMVMILSILRNETVYLFDAGNTSSILEIFLSAFVLTISNPMTIVFWTGLFAAKSIELRLDGNKLIVFGVSAGFATILFLGASAVAISLFKAIIPLVVAQCLNMLVGIILLAYGIIRLVKVLRTRHDIVGTRDDAAG